jgi:transcriptional regulator with XRE-family HTH domain
MSQVLVMARSFGVRLRELREAADMTQQDLASSAGLSIATVRKLEQTDSDPKLSTLRALARALTISLNDFNGGPDEPGEVTESAEPPKPKRKKK